jgi:CRP-like cAMP-binding protein
MIGDILESTELNWEEVSLKRGDYLITPGKVEKSIYFVKEGAFRAFIIDEEEEFTIRFGYKNSIITALPSYFTKEPTELFIQAIRRSQVLKTSKVLFEKYIHQSKETLEQSQTILEDLICSFLAREIDLLTQSPALRYERLLSRSPQVFQEIPHKYIASYLRMSPETLSRLLNS